MLAKHVVVISIDALSETEWQYMNQLPTISNLINTGVSTNKLTSVFPTHTYTVHTTMVTGVHPDKHGITHNHQFQPFVPDSHQNWYLYQDEIKSKTIYEVLKQNKLKTASIMWPVTGNSVIDYCIPEMPPISGENNVLKLIKTGTTSYILPMFVRLRKYFKGIDQPHLDNFTTEMTIDIIKRKKPNLTLVHLIELDNVKHNNRVESDKILPVLKRMDERVKKIIQSTKDANIYDDTVFILLGDHGQFSVDYNVHLNNLFRDNGLITKSEEGWEWRAYLQTTGGNAYLHLKENDQEAEELALKILDDAMKREELGIEAIYDRNKLDKLRADKNVKYVVEGKVGYHFHDDLSDELIEDYNAINKKYATHGYSHEKPGYKCIFIANGKNIKHLDIGAIKMVDIAPTICNILGCEFNTSDGESLLSKIEKTA